MGHAGLAFRPKISFPAKTQTSEKPMADCKESEVKIEDDEKPAKRSRVTNKLEMIEAMCKEADDHMGRETYGMTTGIPALADLDKHAKDLHKALANNVAAKNGNNTQTNGKGKNEDLIDFVNPCEAIDYGPDYESSTQRSCCNFKQSAPKSFNDAVSYLENVKV